jgi:hypothetical protein
MGNPNKHAILARRKKELDHALKHDLGEHVITKRAEKLKAAAISLIKKCRGPFAEVEGSPYHQKWIKLNARWDELTTDEIVALASKWPANPGIREVEHPRGG